MQPLSPTTPKRPAVRISTPPRKRSPHEEAPTRLATPTPERFGKPSSLQCRTPTKGSARGPRPRSTTSTRCVAWSPRCLLRRTARFRAQSTSRTPRRSYCSSQWLWASHSPQPASSSPTPSTASRERLSRRGRCSPVTKTESPLYRAPLKA